MRRRLDIGNWPIRRKNVVLTNLIVFFIYLTDVYWLTFYLLFSFMSICLLLSDDKVSRFRADFEPYFRADDIDDSLWLSFRRESWEVPFHITETFLFRSKSFPFSNISRRG